MSSRTSPLGKQGSCGHFLTRHTRVQYTTTPLLHMAVRSVILVHSSTVAPLVSSLRSLFHHCSIHSSTVIPLALSSFLLALPPSFCSLFHSRSVCSSTVVPIAAVKFSHSKCARMTRYFTLDMLHSKHVSKVFCTTNSFVVLIVLRTIIRTILWTVLHLF